MATLDDPPLGSTDIDPARRPTPGERFYGITELRSLLLGNLDIGTLATMTRCSQGVLEDVVPLLYHDYAFNDYLKVRPTLGLSESVDVPGPRDILYCAAVRTLSISTLSWRAAAFAHMLRLDVKRSGGYYDRAIPMEVDGFEEPNRDIRFNFDSLIDRLRVYFPAMREIRLLDFNSSTRPGQFLQLSSEQGETPVRHRVVDIGHRDGEVTLSLSTTEPTKPHLRNGALSSDSHYLDLAVVMDTVLHYDTSFEDTVRRIVLRGDTLQWELADVLGIMRQAADRVPDMVLSLESLHARELCPYTGDELATVLASPHLARSGLIDLKLLGSPTGREATEDYHLPLPRLLDIIARIPPNIKRLTVARVGLSIETYSPPTHLDRTSALEYLHIQYASNKSFDDCRINAAMLMSHYVDMTDGTGLVIESLGAFKWCFADCVRRLKGAISYDPTALDGLDLRLLGLVSTSDVTKFVELDEREIRSRIRAARGI